MNISDRTTTAMLMAAINGIGARAPKAIIDSYEETARVSAAARALGSGRKDLGVAVTNALTAGRDPGTDPEVQRALIASQISNEGVMTAVQSMVYDRFRHVCLMHADATVIAWRKPFDQAAAKLASCFEQIGPVPLEDTGSIMQQGGNIAAVWAEAQAATRTIESIHSGWTALVQFTRTSQANPDYRVLQLAEVTYSDWTEKDLRCRNLDPWEFLLLGLTLSLPTADEYRQRAMTITDGMAQVKTVLTASAVTSRAT